MIKSIIVALGVIASLVIVSQAAAGDQWQTIQEQRVQQRVIPQPVPQSAAPAPVQAAPAGTVVMVRPPIWFPCIRNWVLRREAMARPYQVQAYQPPVQYRLVPMR